MKFKTEKIVDVSEWDSLVKQTYGKPYSLQQQEGCHSRGLLYVTIPDYDDDYDFDNDSIPEIVNHSEMGVSFDAWLARDVKTPLQNGCDFSLELWWGRNFYPSLQMAANDLHKKGLVEAGKYAINIYW